MKREQVEHVRVTRHEIIQQASDGTEGLIDGVTVRPLTLLPDDRGHFAEVFRVTDPVAERFDFAQTSLTATRAGVIKAFHYHLEQDDIFLPVSGTARIALVDFRTGSPTKGFANSIFAGALYPKAVRIPAGVAHGYEVMPGDDLVMVYYTNRIYNPSDEYRVPWDDPGVGFTWWGIENR